MYQFFVMSFFFVPLRVVNGELAWKNFYLNLQFQNISYESLTVKPALS